MPTACGARIFTRWKLFFSQVAKNCQVFCQTIGGVFLTFLPKIKDGNSICQTAGDALRYVVCSVFVQGPGILSIACHTVKWGRWAGTKQMEHITNTTQSMRLNQMNKDSTPNHRNCRTYGLPPPHRPMAWANGFGIYRLRTPFTTHQAQPWGRSRLRYWAGSVWNPSIG